MKVLITGAGALLGQGIIRALRATTLDATIIAVDPSPLAAGLYWAHRAHLVPLASDPTFLQAFEEILARESPDVVLVGTDVELRLLAAHRARLEETYHTRLLISAEQVVTIAEDKWLTYQFLNERGLGCPRSALPSEVDALIEEVGYPLIIKPRVGCRSVGVRLVEERSALEQALAEQPDAIIQECVATPFDEYTAGALVFEGRCEASIVMRRLLRDGNTYQAFVAPYPELNAQVREIAEALGAYGPVNVQFRLDGERIKVFEINARFSGTTPLRACAGFNEVEIALRQVLYNEPVVQPTVQPMTILRHWAETVVTDDVAQATHALATPSLAGLRAALGMLW
ncbi:carbamoyl phosphate synthase [Lujinxingia litoralis]|uniref:Carbamoyl phosphate synthase n=1 Tax=Lujinxingia litoralis TaxID=2211119 RepID=A0A328C668_9DELT|nr:ATP-grasp domain-containing protein [Lujinxingia litoralis]RAL20490.1 carbamoyl phosphate synthase [Lujinxingia litoralis]